MQVQFRLEKSSVLFIAHTASWSRVSAADWWLFCWCKVCGCVPCTRLEYLYHLAVWFFFLFCHMYSTGHVLLYKGTFSDLVLMLFTQETQARRISPYHPHASLCHSERYFSVYSIFKCTWMTCSSMSANSKSKYPPAKARWRSTLIH